MSISKKYFGLWILVIIFLANYFGIEVFNFYWWCFYLFSVLYLSLLLFNFLSLGRTSYTTYFKSETVLLLLFISIATISVIINQVSLVDAAVALIMKLIPVFFLMEIFQLMMSSNSEKNFSLKHLDRTHKILVLCMFPLVVFQKYVLNVGVDRVSALTPNAHIFAFVFLIGASYFFLKKKNLFNSIFLLIALFSAVIADYKLGLLSFIGAFIVLGFIVGSKKTKIGFLMLTILVGLFFGFLILNPSLLPDRFKLISLFFQSDFIGRLLDTNAIFPAEFELFRGYTQLYTRVLDGPVNYLFGVGPGNYASNIALVKEKTLAAKYVIYYRELLDAEGISNGSLLSRDGVFINLLGEYGILGALVYVLTFFRIAFKPLVYAWNKFNTGYARTFMILLIYFLLNFAFFPVFKDSIYLIALGYFGSLLILSAQNKI